MCDEETVVFLDNFKFHEMEIELMNGHIYKGTIQGIRDEDWLLLEDEHGSYSYIDIMSICRVAVVYEN